MLNRKLYLHYLGLTGVITLGAILRFWHLDLKPLWLDEIITAIFSLGKSYRDLPLYVVFPLHQLQEIFTFQPGVTCSQIAENLARYSTHPPLFFCGMYSWLGWLNPLGTDWVTKLRSLSVLFGVAAIMAIYGVNSIAFYPASGIIAALFMALSPFAVYLSQEARHYTLPMLLIILSLFLLIKIQQDIFTRQHVRFGVWLLWSILNSLGLYIHYFFSIAFSAEIATLSLIIYYGRTTIINLRQICLYLTISTCGVIISYIPWLLVVFSRFRSLDTNWLPSPHHLEPIYHTLINWALMIISLPLENQSIGIAVICGCFMVVFTIWVGIQVFTSLKLLWSESKTHLSTLILLSFTFFVLLQFLIIAYLLGKDITLVPRYSFVYYPGFCALLAASLEKIRTTRFIFLIVGIVSCIFVVNNLTFQKPFLPDLVAKNMNLEPDVPLMLVIKYDSYQDVAAGLSWALALEKLRYHEIQNQSNSFNNDSLAFVYKSADLSSLTHKVGKFSHFHKSQFHLWFVGSGMRKKDYAGKLRIAGQINCDIEPTQHYRSGQFPYQLYRCEKRE
ncbi:glycosyltransferase family 39 protein [Trichormus azollae]|jgi:uncharacterized membrane protein|uniref:Membrane protein-like protein n=1 Tax=Nostoc azollae (strain 0708) TaxID=551115 RepID=D7DWK6_NOSA0|nr:glycosyltransferase family 39 protein [Trichormus azollae]ADI65669.1 membrane protein-like protein ['Nostoc azollae' 0708]